MASVGPADGATPRRPSRRAVRLAGTVGGDDANLISALPAVPVDPDPAATGPRPPAGRPGDVDAGSGATPAQRAGTGVLPDRSADDTDLGWGDRGTGSNDDRLSQDKPPHW